MKINKIGILEGRVLPERLDKFQLFPISNWEKEFIDVKNIGFHYVELLFDKKLALQKVVYSFSNLNCFINKIIKPAKLKVGSICADYFSSISLMSSKARQLFYDYVLKLINLIKNTTIKVIVIPFFDKNSITTRRGLRFALGWIEKNGLDKIAKKNNVILALEIGLAASQIKRAFLGHKFTNIKICYDLGNARGLGYIPEQEIIELKGILAHVHIKDRKINGPNVRLGDGDVDFAACFRSLKKIRYEGPMILETAYFKRPFIEATENLLFVKKILRAI